MVNQRKEEGTRVSPETIEDIVRFHGHMCPGLAMGIRAAEVALREVGPRSPDEEVVALTETNMCAVDAIQYLAGCTFGKGNLIHLDYGKNAYTFIRRSDGKAVRVSTRPGAFDRSPEYRDLSSRVRENNATEEEQARFEELRANRIEAILQAPVEELYAVKEVEDVEIPPMARIHNSIACAGCGDPTMETRVQELEGRKLCPACFDAALSRRGSAYGGWCALSHRDDYSFLAPPGEVADWRLISIFDAADEARLFEELPVTPAEVAARLGLDERAVRILLDALSAWGVVEELDGSYSMRLDWPLDRGETAILRHHARVLQTWSTQLGDRLRGVPPAPSGMPPERRRRWLEALAVGARDQAPLAVEACLRRFPNARSVLDLGGGHGEYARAFARRGLRVTLQDLEPTIELLGDSDLSDSGVELFAGDFFETLPAAQFDLVLCAGITHIFDGERNRLLYRQLASVLAPSGGLAIITFLPERDPRALIFAVQMLAVSAGGNAHSESDYRDWLKTEGYWEPEVQNLGDNPNFLLLASP